MRDCKRAWLCGVFAFSGYKGQYIHMLSMSPVTPSHGPHPEYRWMSFPLGLFPFTSPSPGFFIDSCCRCFGRCDETDPEPLSPSYRYSKNTHLVAGKAKFSSNRYLFRGLRSVVHHEGPSHMLLRIDRAKC